MPRRSLIEQLDDAVEALLAEPRARLPRVNPRLAPLLRVASELRDLPREEFKARLKSELEGRKSMASVAESIQGKNAGVSPIPKGYHTITPYLVAQDAPALIEF